MMLFVSLALAMLLLALAVVIVPLLRGGPRAARGARSLAVLADSMRELDAERSAGTLDPDEHRRTLRELQERSLQAEPEGPDAAGRDADRRGRWSAALLTAIGLPVILVAVYALVGEPMALLGAHTAAAASPHAPGMTADGASQRTASAIDALEQRLSRDSGDAEGWILLARSYLQLQRLPESITAYRRAVALLPANADLLVELANTTAIANQRRLAGEPEQLAERALQIEPDNFNALAFSGLAALQRGDRTLALRRWHRLEALLPAGSDDRRRIGELIAQADEKQVTAAAPPVAADAAAPTPLPAAKPVASIRGRVVLDERLAAKVAPGDTLFVFARAIDGPPVPLAALRARAGDLPLAFTLDDSAAMVQGMGLSRFSRVKVVARISRLGSPQAQPGDIEGVVGDVAVGSGEVRVVMDHVVGR